MVKKLHVGNLAYSVTDESLRNAFSQFGTVDSATVVQDKISGRSKGFGFIEMSQEEEATQAIDKLNKTEFEGRLMFVSESRSTGAPSSSRPGNGGAPRRFGPSSGAPRSDRKPRY